MPKNVTIRQLRLLKTPEVIAKMVMDILLPESDTRRMLTDEQKDGPTVRYAKYNIRVGYMQVTQKLTIYIHL